MADQPEMGLVDVYAAVLEDFSFEPTLHDHYETKTVSVKAGLIFYEDQVTWQRVES